MCVYLKKVLPLQHYTMNRYSFLNSLSHFLVASFILFSMERVTFYIDGFNFYYGIKTEKDISPEWGKSYWIDLVKLCSQFLGSDQVLEKVIYFTASPLSRDASQRQSAFLNANRILNPAKFEVVRGKYMPKVIKCPNCHYSIMKPEEKKTDVNISIRMIGDCMQDKTDRLVLISGDSDLIPPIEFIAQNYPAKRIRVFFPPTISSASLNNLMRRHRSKTVFLVNNFQKFVASIMPDSVSDGKQTYVIPPRWKRLQG